MSRAVEGLVSPVPYMDCHLIDNVITLAVTIKNWSELMCSVRVSRKNIDEMNTTDYATLFLDTNYSEATTIFLLLSII